MNQAGGPLGFNLVAIPHTMAGLGALIFLVLGGALLILALRLEARRENKNQSERLDILTKVRERDHLSDEIDIEAIEEAYNETMGREVPKSKLGRALRRIIDDRDYQFAILAAVGTFVVCFFVLGRFRGMALWVPPTVGIVGAAITLKQMLDSAAEKNRIAFLDAFPDVVDQIVRSTRAGIPFTEAIINVAHDSVDPIKSEFQRIADGLAVGIDLPDVLRVASRRIGLPDFEFFAVCLIVQKESGGQIAETLQGLSTVLRNRKELRKKVHAMTAEPRFSAKAVAALPVVTGCIMYMLNRHHMMILFDDPTGQIILFSATGAVILGLLVSNRMATFKDR